MLFEVVQREVPNRLRFSSPQKSQRRAKNFSNNFHIQMSTKGYIFSYIQTLDSLDFGFFCSSNILYIYIYLNLMNFWPLEFSAFAQLDSIDHQKYGL
jgi:hypothetical protein